MKANQNLNDAAYYIALAIEKRKMEIVTLNAVLSKVLELLPEKDKQLMVIKED